MGVSVVICAKNAEKTIGECLKSVTRNNPSEIIVIDGDSTDETTRIAREYTDKVYSDEGRGIACARQLGAEKAADEYVSYVDSDVILSENTLAQMLEELREKGYTGIHAQIISPENRGYWEWAEDQHFRMRFNREGERDLIGAIAVLYAKDAIIKYRFDPFFDFYGAPEDGDFSHRLRKDGLKLGISSAFAYHQHRASIRSFVRQRVAYGKGNAQAFRKYKSVRYLAGPSLMVPFGILVCIKKKSLRMLPYYLLWSVAGNIGVITRLSQLVAGKVTAGSRRGRR